MHLLKLKVFNNFEENEIEVFMIDINNYLGYLLGFSS